MKLLRLLKNDLAKEIDGWVRDGIITEPQGEEIAGRYGIDYRDPSRHSLGYHLVLILGYLFVGLAVITLVAANWEQVPRALRMGGLISLTLAINGVGLFHFVKGRSSTAVGAFFLGGLCYGASIMLIAQIYHLGEHFPDGIFWWALGVLPVAILLESRLLMLLAFTLGTIWFWVEAGMNYYPASYPLFLAALGWLALLRRQSNLLFMLLCFGVALWAEYNLGWWLSDWGYYRFGAEQLTLGAGLLVIALPLANGMAGGRTSRWIDYGALLHLWVVRLGLLVMLLMSFGDVWWEYIGETQSDIEINIAIVLVCAGISLLLHFISRVRRWTPILVAAVYFILFAGSMFAGDQEDALVFQVIVNLLLILSGTVLIQLGIAKGISHYFYLGVSVILVTGLLRYIDLVGDYLGAAVLFSVFAAILLGAARYWRLKYSQGGRL